MDIVTAFLWVTTISYYISGIWPKQTMKNVGFLREKVELLASAVLLTVALLVDFWLLWVGLSVLWTLYAGFSLLGYEQWEVAWKEDASDMVQTAMFAWNLLMAVACLIKV